MKSIVAVDKKWGIGKKNDLLFTLPEDMAFFRRTTLNKVCCMGYNTLLSFPGSKPLKNRTSIVLAPDGVERDDCIIVHTLEELSKEELIERVRMLEDIKKSLVYLTSQQPNKNTK